MIQSSLFAWFIGSHFVFFILQRLFERDKMFSAPEIRHATSLQTMSHSNMRKRLTNRLDKEGKFRIEKRASVTLIKLFVTLTLFICTIFLYLSKDPKTQKNFFVSFYYDMDPRSSDNYLYLWITTIGDGWYTFETLVGSSHSYKSNIPSLIHHWSAILLCTLVLCGVHLPYGLWFAFGGVFLDFPVVFTLFYRSKYTFKHPKFTKLLLKFSYYWYTFISVPNVIIGEIILLINGLFWNGIKNNNVNIVVTIVFILVLPGFWYDDYLLSTELKNEANNPIYDQLMITEHNEMESDNNINISKEEKKDKINGKNTDHDTV